MMWMHENKRILFTERRKVMKSTKRMWLLMALCFAFLGNLLWTQSVYAGSLNSEDQARQKALKRVKNATVTEVDSDYENGIRVYDVDLVKGNRKYELTYRASNAKLLSFGWEKKTVQPARQHPAITKKEIRQLAKKKVKKAQVTSIHKKYDDGIELYKVKMHSGNKEYTLKYHARTGALLEYEWELEKAQLSNHR